MNKLGWTAFKLKTKNIKRLVIVAKNKEYDRIKDLLNQIGQNIHVLGRVEPQLDGIILSSDELGKIDSLADIVEVNRVDEIVFSGSDLSSGDIIQNMLALKKTQTDYKISPPDSKSIIGSNSINTAGELYVIDINSIAEPSNRRNKRIFDLTVAISLLLTLPLNIWVFIKKPWKFIKSILQVLIGVRTWVGYFPGSKSEEQPLPKIKKSILPSEPGLSELDSGRKQEINLIYAKNYSVSTDLKVIIRYLRGIL